jgi:hypothetical protein
MRLAAFAELAERLFELLLRLAVGRPVTALERILASLPRFPGSLDESDHCTWHPQRGLAVGAARLRRLVAADASAEDALE